MKNDHEHIEEKLIPYLEGVLNAKERREVDEAINSDGALAREMSELRDIILELRQGFAAGLRPPQEELSVEEVVELGANTGTVDSLPGTSQQKARLFCSDQALEEYSLLRALQEEISRTTLDRENVPDMPEALRKEFLAIKTAAGSRKVLAFDRKKISPVPLWRKVSGLLDRIDPKPLMASAAALVMLSLGVHLYQSSAGPAVGTGTSDVAYNFPEAKQSAAPSQPSATPTLAPGASAGVAVFTSDDRGLLKEQAEKLLSNKVRYTVTKDRILVAEKDVKEAREILWAETDEQAVAMASKEDSPEKRLARPRIGAAGAPAPGEASGRVSEEAPVVNADEALEAAAGGAGEVIYSGPSRADAPKPPRSAVVPSYQRSANRGPLPDYREDPEPYDARTSKGSSRRSVAEQPRSGGESARPGEAATLPGYEEPPVPSDVDLSGIGARVDKPVAATRAESPPPEPTVVETRSKANEVPAAVSAARRQRLKELALGDDGAEGSSKKEVSTEVPAPAQASQSQSQSQSTVVLDRARVAAAPPASSASAPVPNAVSAGGASFDADEKEEVKADGRLARMETSRQTVAQKHGVELSFESRDGKVAVYVRPKKTLTKAELDALRKALRKELGLADSDTIIFR
jgi:hypothetical protein